MSKKEWDALFDLIEKLVGLHGASADEKAAEFVRQAKDRGSRTSMEAEEFTSWFFDFDQTVD